MLLDFLFLDIDVSIGLNTAMETVVKELIPGVTGRIPVNDWKHDCAAILHLADMASVPLYISELLFLSVFIFQFIYY